MLLIGCQTEGTPHDAGPPDSGADAGTPCAPGLPLDNLVDGSTTPQLSVVGLPDAGLFLGIEDPSILYAVDAGQGQLAFTRASLDTNTGYIDLATQVAVSSNTALAWTVVAQANADALTSLTCNTSACTDPDLCNGNPPCTLNGLLVHEVPSIVDDPTDPDPSARFKLFTESYLELLPADGGSSNRFRYDIGYIGYETAPAPAGPWTPETVLLGWNGPTTLSSQSAKLDVSSIAAIPDVWALGEPGAVVGPQGLDVAVTAIDLVDGELNLELFRSTDHGATWNHVSRLLDGSFATGLCGASTAFSGADLFFVKGVEYLSAVTGAPEPGSPGAYNACLTFEVANPVAGTLLASDAGTPSVLRRLRAADPRFFGPCTYAEGAASLGYLATEQYVGTSLLLRTYATGIPAP